MEINMKRIAAGLFIAFGISGFSSSSSASNTDDFIIDSGGYHTLECYLGANGTQASPVLNCYYDTVVVYNGYASGQVTAPALSQYTIVKIQRRIPAIPNDVCARTSGLVIPQTVCWHLTKNNNVINFASLGAQTDTDVDINIDANDNCPLVSNGDQLNSDGDLQGNACDLDDDNDLMADTWELTYGLNPLVNDANADADNDGLTNLQEYTNGSNPAIAVTIKNDYNSDAIAGWIWKGQSNGVETQSQIWQLTFPLLSANFGVPNRFYPPPFPDQANWEILTTGDFNKDGDADIVWRNLSTAEWKVWQMQNGMRAAQNTLADFDIGHAWQVIGAGDTDKDGDDDVILNSSSTGYVMIWEMQDHAIANTHNIGAKPGYVLNRIGDFNKDGDVDLLFHEIGTDVLVTWELEANAFVTERALANTGANYNPVCAGDFDNDGDDDIMLVNSSTTQEKWFVMENYARTQAFGSSNTGFVFKGCGDYDGDGDTDTLWQRSADDANRVVLQQNYGTTKQTVCTNSFGGANPGAAGYGFVYRGNSN